MKANQMAPGIQTNFLEFVIFGVLFVPFLRGSHPGCATGRGGASKAQSSFGGRKTCGAGALKGSIRLPASLLRC